MSFLGEVDSFRELIPGTVSLGVPVVDGAVQINWHGGPSVREELSVAVQEAPGEICPSSVAVSRKDGALLQVRSNFEVFKDGKYTPTSQLLFDEPIPEVRFVLSPSGLWTTEAVAITDENRSYLTGFAELVGRHSLRKQKEGSR